MSARPTPDQLPQIRRTLQKQALPFVSGELWGSQPGVGGFRFVEDGDDFRVEWIAGKRELNQPLKNASFRELCTSPSLELERLELGWLIADLFDMHASRVIESIPGPNEYMREKSRDEVGRSSAAAPFREAAARWRHWALVPAGHMEFSE